MTQQQPRVLIVDGLSETEEVLRVVLEPRGVQVDRMRTSHGTLPSGDCGDIVVLDAVEETRNEASWQSYSRVVLTDGEAAQSAVYEANRQQLMKPFHYSELIQTIECLLARADAA